MCTLEVGKKTWCLFLPVFFLIPCISVTSTPLVCERLLPSMPPQHAATRPLARAYNRARNSPVTSVDAPSGQARRTCQLTAVPFGVAVSRYNVPLPAFPSHCYSAGLHSDCSYKELRAFGAPVGGTGTSISPASRYTRGSVSSISQGTYSFANVSTTLTSSSLTLPLQKPRLASYVPPVAAPSASGTRVPWGRLPRVAGFALSPQSPHTLRTGRRYAFLTGKRQLLCLSRRCFASATADSKHVATMEIPETPVVLSGEPLYIPLVGCKPAENAAIGITPYKNAAAFSGDLVIFGLLSCKSSPGAASRGVKEEKKCKNELACFSPEIKEMDKKLTHGMLYEAAQHDDFEAKLGTHMGVRVSGSEGAGKKILHAVALGLGAATELKPAAAAKAGAAVAALLQRPGYNKAKQVGVIWPRIIPSPPQGAAEAGGAVAADTPAPRAAADALQRRLLQSFLESFLVEMQPDTRFKGESGCDKEKSSRLEKIAIYAEGMDESYQKNIDAARILAKSVYFAQELVNAPANFCNPVTLAQAAVQMAKKAGITAEVLQQKELEKLGMFSYLSVNKGSLYPPQFIHLTYTPRGGPSGSAAEGQQRQALKRLVFVGKGVCFDSGGYNIKSAASMIELMKFDMAGGAAVLGALLALGHLQPPHVEVHALVAACENMVSEKAYRPGDVITAADGKTIEVGNTDAEGRLTLADALVYAEKYLHPHILVDVATLTGAVLIALGHRYAALYSTCDTLADHLLHSAENSGELMWRMPLVKEYAEALESKIADLQNVGGKNKAGSILGAVFLEQFIQNTPWAHLDIAGTAWDTKRSRATGYGVRTLVEYALEISRQQGAALGN